MKTGNTTKRGKWGKTLSFLKKIPGTSCSRTRSLIRPGRAKAPARTNQANKMILGTSCSRTRNLICPGRAKAPARTK